MTITFGFYNSYQGDRVYDSTQLSSLFDGLITNGVFMSIGDALMVSPGVGLGVNVGSGRAWFDRTWTYNDAPVTLHLDVADLVLPRIDVVYLETDSATRTNSIKILAGTPSSDPEPPAMNSVPGDPTQRHPLAQILVDAGVSQISISAITNLIGTDECPFVTGVVQNFDISALIAQWQSQWDDVTAAREDAFVDWFDNIRDQLSTDAAGNLQNQINDIVGYPLTESRIYYVRTNGNDSNTGLVDSAGGAFRTIQKAVDVASALKLNSQTVFIVLAAGTYAESVTLRSFTEPGVISIQGGASGVYVSPESGTAFSLSGRGNYEISNMTISAQLGSAISVSDFGRIYVSAVKFGVCQLYHLNVYYHGTLGFSSNCEIVGAALYHAQVSSYGLFICEYVALTIVNNNLVFDKWINVDRFSTARCAGINFVNKSYVTSGKRYEVSKLGLLETTSGSATYFPGTTAGSVATGGQYV